MAENKKSFLLYSNLIHTIKKLPDEKAGVLFKTILEYVNDLNPVIDDLLVEIAFEPIKQQLKYDLKKWDQYIEKQQVNGSKGGRPLKTQKTQAFFEKPKKADNVNVIVNDNIKKESNKEKRKSDFSKILQTISENYDQDVLNDFFNYWTESGINDQKMRFEKEKSFDVNLRLKTWIKNQKKWEVQKNTNQGPRPHQENAGVLLLKKYGIR